MTNAIKLNLIKVEFSPMPCLFSWAMDKETKMGFIHEWRNKESRESSSKLFVESFQGVFALARDVT